MSIRAEPTIAGAEQIELEARVMLKQWCRQQEGLYGTDWKKRLAAETSPPATALLIALYRMSGVAKGGEGEVGGAPAVVLPVARPVPPGDSYYERLAAPLVPLPSGDETLAQREARRLRHRLPEGYEPRSGADLTFNPLIAYELALGVSSAAAVFAKYTVSLEEAKRLIGLPHFLQTIREYREELTTKGVTFRLKAKIQAEDLLTHSYVLATDPEVPAAVRADLIKWTAKMAALEPGEKDKGGGAAGAGFTLNITFAGGPVLAGSTAQIIDGTSHRVEDT